MGEGIICDLRQALFAHMQRMSMRFFTDTKTGEMTSRLNNDVNGAQRVVTGTLIDLITNIISLVSTLVVMVSMEWRLTLIGVIILPLFILLSRRMGRVLRGITRQHMQLRAEMSALMNETLNVSGALLVKIFGRKDDEVRRFAEKTVQVRDISVKDPRVLILDEATSHLDSESEELIQRALERVMVGRTSLVIAHRLSTILATDRILVIDQGRLVQRGTHEVLLAQGGLYRDLYEKQFSVAENCIEQAAPQTSSEPNPKEEIS